MIFHNLLSLLSSKVDEVQNKLLSLNDSIFIPEMSL